IGLGVPNEFLEILGRHVVVNDQDRRRAAETGDVRISGHRVSGRIETDGGRNDQPADSRYEQRITVRRGIRRLGGGDQTAGARLALGHELLIECGGKLFCGKATERVGGTAGRKRDEYPPNSVLEMTALGHQRPWGSKPHAYTRPLRPKSDCRFKGSLL